MEPLLTAIIVLVLALLGAAMGIWLRPPAAHMESESRDVVKSVMGLIATLTALVLSLVVASAKTAYDAQANDVREIAAKVIMLDRLLALYGPETNETRQLMRRAVTDGVDRVWPSDPSRAANIAPAVNPVGSRNFFDGLHRLSPTTDLQKTIKDQALQVGLAVTQTRVLAFSQSDSTVSIAFVAVLVLWITILFAGYGLFARPNATVVAALVVGAVSVAGAIFLILELDQPYTGLLKIPDTIMRHALTQLGKS